MIGSLSGGGAERVLVDTVNNLPKDKFDITVQTIYDEGVYKENIKSHIKYKTIVSVKNAFLRKIANYIIMHYASAKWLYNRFVDDEYDYEVAFLEGLPTKIISKSYHHSIKYAWVHTDLKEYFDSAKVFSNQEEYAKSYKKFDKVICVSESAKNGFIYRFGNIADLKVVYNIVDENEIIKKSMEEADIDKDDMNIISVGRLVPQKGYDRLIKVAARLKEDGYSFKIRIIGDGVLKSHLEKLIYEFGLRENVFLLGYLINPYSYIAKSKVLVCSSVAEGFSTVVTEALILGTPVITTDCSGMREIFGGYRCGEITDNDQEGLYNALKKILKEPHVIHDYKKNATEAGARLKMNKRILEFLKLFE